MCKSYCPHMTSTISSQEGNRMCSSFYWILSMKLSINVHKLELYGKGNQHKRHIRNRNKNITNRPLLNNSHNWMSIYLTVKKDITNALKIL